MRDQAWVRRSLAAHFDRERTWSAQRLDVDARSCGFSAGKERRTLACGPGCDEIARCVPDVGGYTRDRTAADDVESRAPIGQTEGEALAPSDVDDSRRD